MKSVKSFAALGCGANAVIALGETTSGTPSFGYTISIGLPFFFTW